MASATDNFNRADGALAGSTCSDGVNTWSVTGGSWAIFTNRIEWTPPGGADYVAWVSSLPDCATQTVEATLAINDIGVVARYSVSSGLGTFYMAYAPTIGGAIVLYKCVAGSFTSITSAGTFAANDVIRVECSGTTIVVKQNGSTIITQSDSSVTTGKAGLYAGGNASSKTYDDFAFTGTADSGGSDDGLPPWFFFD